MNPPPAVRIVSVSKRYGEREAVRDLSLEIPEGCVCGFLGPNGAGKSTTLRMILGILVPDAGEIRLFGDHAPGSLREAMAYLPEEKGLYRRMTVRDLLRFLGRLRGMSRDAVDDRSQALLKRFDLAHMMDARCEALSKGMAQKLQLAGTLLHEPRLIILDEPFSGLDPLNVELVRGVIRELREGGATIIVSTHVMEQAEQLCDQVLLLDAGSPLLCGPIAEVRASAEPTLIIDHAGDPALLENLPGVRRVNNAGVHAELSLDDDADPDRILAQLAGRLPIRRFEMVEPSLHEVFVRTVQSQRSHTSPSHIPGGVA